MPKTVAAIDAAITKRIVPVGPWSRPYEELRDEWAEWLASITSEDLSPVIESGFQYACDSHALNLDDPFLGAWHDCLVRAACINPYAYLEYAEAAANDSNVRPLFILTAGNLYFDEAVAWLAALPDRVRLSDEELRWTADSLSESGIPIALPALDRVIEQIRARNLPILEMVLGWRTSLAEHLEKQAAIASAERSDGN